MDQSSEPASSPTQSARIDASLRQRKVIHVDMDAFYAAVEVRDQPELAGKPLIVGGSPTGRGVVATASYEARKFGIHSAMPAARAVRLCPNAVFVRPNFERYRAESEKIRAIFRRYTDDIQTVALDEAYLDVTDQKDGLWATEVARRILAAIRDELQLSASAGVGPNKLIAKIASDMDKPGGLTVVRPEDVRRFMAPLALRKINGVGPVSARKLAAKGLETCADVWQCGEAAMLERFGNFGSWLWQRSQGLDSRPVSSSRVRKSCGKESTFSKNLTDLGQMEAEIKKIAERVWERFERTDLLSHTVTLKVRYPDFTTLTRAKSQKQAFRSAAEIYEAGCQLLRKTAATDRGVRLLGLSLSQLEPRSNRLVQPSLFGD